MKNTYFIYILLVSVFLVQCTPKTGETVNEDFRQEAPEPGPAPEVNIGDYESFELDNGLTVIVVENRKLPRVSFSLTVDRDPIKEDEKVGYISMAGELMSKGTKNRAKAEIDQAVDFMGANLSTSSTGVFASSLTKHIDGLLEIMTDVLYNPVFPEEEFEKLKKQTISGLQTAKNDPNAIASNVSQVVRYGADHPYGEVTTEETVNNIELGDCQAYYEKYFKPNISYLVIVGDINMAEAKPLVKKYFGSWEKGEVPSHEYNLPEIPDETKVVFVNRPGAVQSVINVTYPIILKPGDDDWIKTRVTNAILGGGFSSRLMQNLREDKAFTYGARSSVSNDELVGYFNAGASVRNEVTDSAIQEFLYEMKRIVDEPVSEDELNPIKNWMAGTFALSLESPQTIARFVLNTYRYDLPEDYYQNYLERLSEVTVADVQAMARKYIRPDGARIVVVGSKADVADKLSRFSENKEILFLDPFGNPIMPADPQTASKEPMDVIKDYIKAIGGKDNLENVTSIKQEMSASVMGQELTMIMYREEPNKFAMSTNMMGMTVSRQVFDGENGYVEQQGQKQELGEEQLAQMREQSTIFSELAYLTGDKYSLSSDGMEKVDGKDAYVIIVEDDKGNKTTEYYSAETGLKLREVSTSEQGGQTMTVTNDYKEYKEVDGIMFPHKMVTTGAMPAPLNINVSSIEINKDIPDTVFQ